MKILLLLLIVAAGIGLTWLIAFKTNKPKSILVMGLVSLAAVAAFGQKYGPIDPDLWWHWFIIGPLGLLYSAWLVFGAVSWRW